MLLSLVVPFYNEEETTDYFFARVMPVLSTLSGFDYEIVCVDDGSQDGTLAKLHAFRHRIGHIKIVELSRNFGKEAALTAGLDEANGDLIVPFDADLQDPPEVIPLLIEKWRLGHDVVLAKRIDRPTDSFAKRKCAALFYKAHNALTNLHLPDNVGDFRLFTREVLESLRSLPERQRFMKGLFAWVGYKSAVVEYVREPRVAGKTKFSGWKLWNFAVEGLTSFSTLPLRVWTYVGVTIALTALCYGAFLVVRTLVQGNRVPGYASLASMMLFLGGVQLIGIGVIGEYVGRIYFESKQRPIYLVRRRHQASRAPDSHAYAPRRDVHAQHTASLPDPSDASGARVL
jgi:glycosyltransferase involved in cell wall biosynthesis